MIVSRTPYRISFLGGGTDIEYFYKEYGGEVLSTTIDKYMYVSVNKNFDDSIRLSYSKTERVGAVDNLEHELIRESMRMTGVTSGIEMITIGDIPAGTGLASSSVVTVGGLHALYSFCGKKVALEKIAADACEIEIDILNEPIGKQDQYAVAVGGLNHIQFHPGGEVKIERVKCEKDVKERLQKNLILVYTGKTRRANDILSNDHRKTSKSVNSLKQLKGLVGAGKAALEDGDLTRFGEILHEGWELKKNSRSRRFNTNN